MLMQLPLSAEVVQIHLLGRPATGDLKRPFKAGGMMGTPSTSAGIDL